MNDSANLSANEPASPPPVLANPSIFRKIFFGADGLRAGWSLCIFITLLAGARVGIPALIGLLHQAPRRPATDTDLSPAGAIIGESVAFLVTLLITWIMSKIEGRPSGVYGLGGQRSLPSFFAGLAWGLACLSLLVLLLSRTGLLVFDSRLLFGPDILLYGAIWLLGFLCVGLLEEYLTRGFLLYTLTRGLAGLYFWLFKTRHSKVLGFWTAAIGLSFLFGLGHGNNHGESPIGLLSAGLASMVFCLSLWRTGALWWAIGFHATWDWAQSFLFGVADSGLMVQHRLFATHPVGKPILSGGATGPEGSIFILLILPIITAIILYTLPRTTYGDPALTYGAKNLETA